MGGLFFSLLTGQAVAGPLPVSWSFRNPTNEIAFPEGATGGFSFPNTPYRSFTGGGEIVAAKLSSYSVAAESDPDRVSGLPYRFTLELRDDASGDTAGLRFEGVLSGSVWRTGSDLRNRFTGGDTRSADLGGHTYTVSLTAFDGPDGYGDGEAGSITARVSIADVGGEPETPGGGPVVSATPEPATAILAIFDLPVVGLVRAARQPPRRPAPHGGGAS
jgi:hypothetical protein